MTPSDEGEAAGWIGERLHRFAQDVGSVVPSGFEAYVRIFHPAWRLAGTKEVEVRWSDVAEWGGRIVHPEMQFHSISVPLPDRETRLQSYTFEPRAGSRDRAMEPRSSGTASPRSEEHTSELQSPDHLVCRLL